MWIYRRAKTLRWPKHLKNATWKSTVWTKVLCHLHVASAVAALLWKSIPWSSRSADVLMLMHWEVWSSSGSLYWMAKITAVYWTVYNIILKRFHEQVSPFSSFSTPQWDNSFGSPMLYYFFIAASDIHNVPFKHGIWATVMAQSFGSGTKYIFHALCLFSFCLDDYKFFYTFLWFSEEQSHGCYKLKKTY